MSLTRLQANMHEPKRRVTESKKCEPRTGRKGNEAHFPHKYIDYDYMQATEEVGPDPVTCNGLITLIKYDPTKEFPELLPDEKPTELPPLRYSIAIIPYRIHVTLHCYLST